MVTRWSSFPYFIIVNIVIQMEDGIHWFWTPSPCPDIQGLEWSAYHRDRCSAYHFQWQEKMHLLTVIIRPHAIFRIWLWQVYLTKMLHICAVLSEVTVSTKRAVADLGGVRGVQMHPPLAASNAFLHTYCTSPSNDYAAVACSNNNQAQLHTHVSVPYWSPDVWLGLKLLRGIQLGLPAILNNSLAIYQSVATKWRMLWMR